jgi:hypothetical protein
LRSEIVKDGLALARKLEECLSVIDALAYLAVEFEALFKPGALLQDSTGAFLIGPEIRFRDLLLQLFELPLLAAAVKETSARPRCEF